MWAQASTDGITTITIQLAGINVSAPEYSLSVEYRDPSALLSAIQEILGFAPAISEAPDGVEVAFYDWDGIRVLVPTGAPASIAVSVAAIGGISVTTDDGIVVGASRTLAVAAGAQDVGEGADSLGLGAREAGGTVSLSRPGEVGLDFLRLRLSNDAVSQIQAPAFDYGDI